MKCLRNEVHKLTKQLNGERKSGRQAYCEGAQQNREIKRLKEDLKKLLEERNDIICAQDKQAKASKKAESHAAQLVAEWKDRARHLGEQVVNFQAKEDQQRKEYEEALEANRKVQYGHTKSQSHLSKLRPYLVSILLESRVLQGE